MKKLIGILFVSVVLLAQSPGHHILSDSGLWLYGPSSSSETSVNSNGAATVALNSFGGVDQSGQYDPTHGRIVIATGPGNGPSIMLSRGGESVTISVDGITANGQFLPWKFLPVRPPQSLPKLGQ